MGNKHKLLVTFTERPKGIRANVKLSRDIKAKGMEHVQVTMSHDSIVIRPAFDDKTNKSIFKVSWVAGGVAFMAAAALFEELEKREMLGKKVELAWNARRNAYEGDLSNVQANDGDQDNINREKGVETPLLRLSVRPVLGYKGIRRSSKDEEGRVQPSHQPEPSSEEAVEDNI